MLRSNQNGWFYLVNTLSFRHLGAKNMFTTLQNDLFRTDSLGNFFGISRKYVTLSLSYHLW